MDTVSVVVPIFNEENYIEGFINSIKSQDYDFNKIEVLLVDGNSSDKTLEKLKNILKDNPFSYKILNNNKRITPISLNMAIKEAKNDIIIRLDAHSTYPANYISKCVYYINNIDADSVGCNVKAEASGSLGQAISNVLSSKFGVGNSKFRTSAKSGYVDTVPFGTFRRELFDRIGYYDERLERNQDSEFSSRIIKNGGKIYLFDDINITYYPRNTILKLIKMALKNGSWNLYTNYLCPGSMKLRHFIPFIFVLYLIFGITVSILNISFLKYAFLGVLLIYFILDFIFSFKEIKDSRLLVCLISFVVYPIFHINYGLGTFGGFYLIVKKGKK